MNSTQLLNEILPLKLQLDLCSAAEATGIQAAIDSKRNHIQLLSKLSMARIDAVIAHRYPEYVKKCHLNHQFDSIPTCRPIDPSI